MKSLKGTSYGWAVLGSFTLNYSLVIIAITTLGIFLPEISTELSLSPSQQGWLASSVLLAHLVLEIPFNWWFSRYDPWKVACIAFLGAALLIAFIAWAPTFAILLIGRVGLGLLYLSIQAPRTLVILQWIPKKHVGLANGILFSAIMAIEGVGFIVLPLLLVWLGGWRITFYTWAAVCAVTAVIWLLMGKNRSSREEVGPARTDLKSPLTRLFKYREPWILGIGIIGVMSGRFAFSTFWPTFTGDEYGNTVTSAGLVIGMIYLASSPAMIGVSVLPFFSRRTPMILVVCGIGISLTYLGLLFTGQLHLLIMLGILNGLAFCFFPAVVTEIYKLPEIRPREVAVMIALVFTMDWMGSALGPLMTGFIQEATDNLRLALVIASFCPLSITAAGLVLSTKGKRMLQVCLTPISNLRSSSRTTSSVSQQPD